ncbi:uncharacterized protein TRAVEDRAFT_20473 [Trametes versicolor FP-101664 SS1]|uniref:uncharacterized protein n=1 Tax=Trametes versicolor (strain FP-101664) TaxID=717944 RepID=UPI0004623A7D|nr:uncharacterized protein TRAVEDRAFT_20473 [Trametes versicolor FP-101664 SS1]EIW58474.1 hypothetical protein TRAVEDRAFT_20473 [Trametes versicolor FP-101664 SS1]
MAQTTPSQEPPLCVQFPDKPRGFPVKLWRDQRARATYRASYLLLDRPKRPPVAAPNSSKSVVGTVEVDSVHPAPRTNPPPRRQASQNAHHLPNSKSSSVGRSPGHPCAASEVVSQHDPAPIMSMPTVASVPSATHPSATPSGLNPSFIGHHQASLRHDIVLPPQLQNFYSVGDPRAADTVRFFESLYTISQPLVIPPVRPNAISPSSSPPRHAKRGTVGSSSGGVVRHPAAEQRPTRYHPYPGMGNAHRPILPKGGFAHSSGRHLVTSNVLIDPNAPMFPMQPSAHPTYARRGDTSLVQGGLKAPDGIGAPVPTHPFAMAQEASATEPLPMQRRPKRPYPKPISHPPGPSPSLASRRLHARADHDRGRMDFHPQYQHRIGPPGAVIAPRLREHNVNGFLARINIGEENTLASTLIPTDATFSFDSREAVAPDAPTRMSDQHEPDDGTGYTQAHRPTSNWTQNNSMAAPHYSHHTSVYPGPSAIAHRDGFALTQSFGPSMGSEHPIGGYAHFHNGWSINPPHPQSTPAPIDALPLGLPSDEAPAFMDPGAFTPQPPLWNAGERTAPYGRAVTTSTFSVGSQDNIAPPFIPPSYNLRGHPHALFPPNTAALDRVDEIASRGAGAQRTAEQSVDPGGAPSHNPTRSAAIVGRGLQFYCEDIDQAPAPLGSPMHGMPVERFDLAFSTGSLPVARPYANNRDMLHCMFPMRKSSYSSLAGALTSLA